jgi:hypothetical protein
VQVGCPATAFVTVIDGGPEVATGVSITPRVCLQPPAASVRTTIAGGATPTFTILIQATGANVPFDPAGRRIFVRFEGAQQVTRGSTSVAMRTQ